MLAIPVSKLMSINTNWTYSGIRSLEKRKEAREEAWKIDGWAETVYKVGVDSFYMP